MTEKEINLDSTYEQDREFYLSILKRIGVTPSEDNVYINNIIKSFSELGTYDKIIASGFLKRL